MPAYKVELLDRQTHRQLDRIHEPDFGRIAQAILNLEDDPRPPGYRKLHELEGWRIRVGRWCILYLPNHPLRPVPILVYIHGGGWNALDKSWHATEVRELEDAFFYRTLKAHERAAHERAARTV